VLNFAGTTRKNQPPVALAGLYDHVIQDREESLLIVSPAGNEGDTRMTWPARFHWVVGVGALGENGRLAGFSNHGPSPSVNVYAPGENFVNAYAEGTYITLWDGQAESRLFGGLAGWSGTSFSAPLVAGLVAARMSSTGQTVRAAWNDLATLADQQQAPDAGPSLMPGQELDA
jgi:subtilisin family serine protease